MGSSTSDLQTLGQIAAIGGGIAAIVGGIAGAAGLAAFLGAGGIS